MHKSTKEGLSQPVFIFSAGWRSGSTLLQRLITASGEILVWGEAGGALDCLQEARHRYEQMLGPGMQRYRYGFGGNGEQQYHEFRTAGSQGAHRWIACMNPPGTVLDDAFRRLFVSLYGIPATELGYERWGIKEVQSGLQAAEFLRGLFPTAKFVFLVRHPLRCLRSLKRHNWMDRPDDRRALEYYAGRWVRLAAEFRQTGFGHKVLYENLVADPDSVHELMDYLGLPVPGESFVSKSRVRGNIETETELTWWELRRARSIVGREMAEWGYR